MNNLKKILYMDARHHFFDIVVWSITMDTRNIILESVAYPELVSGGGGGGFQVTNLNGW